MVSEQATLDRYFSACPRQGMSIESWVSRLVSLEEILSHTPKKPSMAEENKNDGAYDSINLLLEKALTRQRDEMMENFSHVLQCLSIEESAYSSRRHFGGASPFKV